VSEKKGLTNTKKGRGQAVKRLEAGDGNTRYDNRGTFEKKKSIFKGGVEEGDTRKRT